MLIIIIYIYNLLLLVFYFRGLVFRRVFRKRWRGWWTFLRAFGLWSFLFDFWWPLGNRGSSRRGFIGFFVDRIRFRRDWWCFRAFCFRRIFGWRKGQLCGNFGPDFRFYYLRFKVLFFCCIFWGPGSWLRRSIGGFFVDMWGVFWGVLWIVFALSFFVYFFSFFGFFLVFFLGFLVEKKNNNVCFFILLSN